MKKPISFDTFQDAVIKHISKRFLVPEAVLKMKFAKEPTLSEAILKVRLKDQFVRDLHRLQISDIMFNEFLNTSLAQLYSQYRHMWE